MTRNWSDVTGDARRRVAGSKWGQPRLLFELVLGVTLVAGGAIGVAVWQRSVTQPQTVVVAARDLARGDTLQAADLRLATVNGARGVQVMSADEAGGLVGGMLTVDLAAATPLTPTVVEWRTSPSPGQALVGVALRPGEAPPDLTVGDTVSVVTVRLDPLGSAPPDVTYDRGEVWSVTPPGDLDTTTVVTLRVAVEVLERVALADRVRLGVLAS